MNRPGHLVVITGTGTDVGKTWVGAALVRAWRAQGLGVAARKPTQSFAPDGRDYTDARILAGATGEDPAVVSPAHRSYEVAMAPPMAAEVLGRPAFTIDDLAAEIIWPIGIDVGVVEGAGGPRSPLASDGDTVDLSRALTPDGIVVVADAGLGVINAARLALAPFVGIGPASVYLNRYDSHDDLHVRNRVWLERECEVDVEVSTLAARLTAQRP